MTERDGQGPGVAPLDRLRRWELFGGHWHVKFRGSSLLEIGLLTCDGGEEIDEFTTNDPGCVAYVGSRNSDQD